MPLKTIRIKQVLHILLTIFILTLFMFSSYPLPSFYHSKLNLQNHKFEALKSTISEVFLNNSGNLSPLYEPKSGYNASGNLKMKCGDFSTSNPPLIFFHFETFFTCGFYKPNTLLSISPTLHYNLRKPILLLLPTKSKFTIPLTSILALSCSNPKRT